MKQNILLSALLAAMLVIAGCGGGNNGFTQEELDDAVQKAVTEAKEGTVTEEDAKQRETTAKNEGLEEGKKQGRMEAEQEQENEKANEAMKALLVALDEVDPNAPTIAMQPAIPPTTAAADQAKQSIKGKEGRAFNAGTNAGLAPSATSDGYYGVTAAGSDDASALIRSDAFSTSNIEKTHKEPVQGTYRGVAGTFRCVGTTPCTSSSNGQPSPSITLEGTWQFKPNNPADKVSAADDPATWGWWLDKDDSGNVEKVNLYYYTTGVSVVDGTIAALTGTATYEGDALGKYAIPGDSPEHGHFEAKAKLNADFGDRVAQGKITGYLDSFKVGNDGAARAWKVHLNLTTANADNIDATSDVTGKTVWDMNGDADGGTPDLPSDGKWQAGLYGTSAEPDHILGAFNAEHGTARMAGSFGAAHKP